MSYLIDTNVLSELRRKTANPGVVSWFQQRPASSLFLSVLTWGELRKGAQSIGDPSRRLALLDWLEIELPAYFSGRILPVDVPVVDLWGHLVANAGRPLPAIDSLIGATAVHHGLGLVTRNVKDYADLGVEIINPWTD